MGGGRRLNICGLWAICDGMKRLFDVVLSVLLLLLSSIPILLIALLVKLTSEGPVLACEGRI